MPVNCDAYKGGLTASHEAKDSIMKRIHQNRIDNTKDEQQQNDGQEEAFKLAPFNPSSDQIQNKALHMLDLGPSDVLFDIGCGDGRFLCFAANQIRGLQCVGIELEREYVYRARVKVREAKLEDAIDIRWKDATKASETNNNSDVEKVGVQSLTLSEDATALYLFILPKGIVKMMPILESLRKRRLAEGKRLQVLSYMFQIHDWEATKTDETAKGSCPVYYYDFHETTSSK